MRTLFLATFVFVLSALPCHGQQTAIRAGSAEAARSISEATQRAVRDNYDWKTTKKLSLYEKDRSSPRSQGECIRPSELANDSVGYLDYWESAVIQVVGPKDLLLMLGNYSNPPLWLTDYPTADVVDGQKVRIVGLIEVIGKKTYATQSGGEKTVRAIRFVTNARKAELDVIAAAKKKVADDAAEAALIRTWTDDTGSHTFEGKFIEFKNGKAHFKRKDSGKVIAVLMSRLSKNDQQWIRDHLRGDEE